MITLQHYLVVSALLFIIGLAGLIVRRNLIAAFMSVIIALVAANIAILGFSRWMLLGSGNIISIFVMSVGAVVVPVGLVLLSAYIVKHKKLILGE